MSEQLTERQRTMLRHALGLNIADVPYRNWFAAGAKDLPVWLELVAMDFAAEATKSTFRNFHVTDAGREALTRRPTK
jgi:hypothetical protein